jgi:type IV pilus assembly protein PilV
MEIPPMAALETRRRRQQGAAARSVHRGARPVRIDAAAGYSMIEVLVSLVILLLGLLGLLGLQARAQTAEMESYQRAQAIVLLQDIADRMNANRSDAWALAYHEATAGGATALADCSGKTGAALDVCQWGNALMGAAEVAGNGTCSTTGSASCVGAMIGARGCILYDSTTELTDSTGNVLAGSGVYTISIAWQGIAPTAAPASTLTCGYGRYAGESKRRIVTSTVRIAALGAS